MRNKLFKIAPLIVGALLVIMMISLNKKYGVNYRNFGGYENILESMVNFLSIVIGFYSAFYGMIMYKSKFMKELLKSKYRNELPLLLVFSLVSAFACLILTIIMQSLITYKLEITNLLYYVWFLLVGIFVTYAFQTSLLSVAMIFESNPQKKKPINL